MILLVLFTIILVQMGVGLAYLYVLLTFGGRRTDARQVSDRWLRLAVALPAHNEEAVIGPSIQRLLECDYPREYFDVHVVADFCVDNTATVAAAAGAIVHQRNTGTRGRKGYALGWLFQRLLADPKVYDAIVVFDADSRVDLQFLKHVNRALNCGAQVVQGRHVISNPSASLLSALADADMRLNNRIHNQAKVNLGLSARLMGDAMCFHRRVLETYPWARASSLAEDREYGINLAIKNIRVAYEPGAISAGQATARWKDATHQRVRWYGGVFEIQKQYLWPLLVTAICMRNAVALDLALELLLPPFSTLAVLTSVTVPIIAALAIVHRLPWTLFFVAIGLAILAFIFPVIGLATEHAPRSAFRALLVGPLFALWRVWIGVRVAIRRGNIPWVRTRRSEESES